MPSSDTQFKSGDDWKGNSKGRPKGKSLKEYDRERFSKMSVEEREEFLATISPEMRYRMAEGNPHQGTDITTKGEKINNAWESITTEELLRIIKEAEGGDSEENISKEKAS